MSARYFFHLDREGHAIPDKMGIEVSELDQVRDVLVQTVCEMLREQDLSASELEGWDVRVVDAAGNAITTVRLGGLKDLSS